MSEEEGDAISAWHAAGVDQDVVREKEKHLNIDATNLITKQ